MFYNTLQRRSYDQRNYEIRAPVLYEYSIVLKLLLNLT